MGFPRNLVPYPEASDDKRRPAPRFRRKKKRAITGPQFISWPEEDDLEQWLEGTRKHGREPNKTKREPLESWRELLPLTFPFRGPFCRVYRSAKEWAVVDADGRIVIEDCCDRR